MPELSDSVEDFQQPTADPGPDPLNPDAILAAEFNYIAQTAFQTDEDRSTVTSFFLVSVGSLVAAILSTQLLTRQDPAIYLACAAFFVLLSINGLLTVLQLARLRQAWFESIQALNQIKEYYVQHFGSLKLEQAFRWRQKTIPPRFKSWSISYMLAAQVAFLSGGLLGAAVAFTGMSLSQNWAWPAAAGGVISAAIQMALYRRLLIQPKPKR